MAVALSRSWDSFFLFVLFLFFAFHGSKVNKDGSVLRSLNLKQKVTHIALTWIEQPYEACRWKYVHILYVFRLTSIFTWCPFSADFCLQGVSLMITPRTQLGLKKHTVTVKILLFVFWWRYFLCCLAFMLWKKPCHYLCSGLGLPCWYRLTQVCWEVTVSCFVLLC